MINLIKPIIILLRWEKDLIRWKQQQIIKKMKLKSIKKSYKSLNPNNYF